MVAVVLAASACGDRRAASSGGAVTATATTAGAGETGAGSGSGRASLPRGEEVGQTGGGERDGWQEGARALEEALSGKVPVLLYMSSEWCPPCRALEANLLSKAAFLEATRGVVRVRIDGDSEGAQAVAERYEAEAYPTLLLLSGSGEELFRAHHAVSLEEVAPAVAAATAEGGNFKGAVRRMAGGGEGRASAADCALFAAMDWGAASGMTMPVGERLSVLTRAFVRCGEPGAPAEGGGLGDKAAGQGSSAATRQGSSAATRQGSSAATRAVIAAHLLGLAATLDTNADSALPAASFRPMADSLVDAILASEETAWAARTLVTTWVTPVVSWVLGADRGARFAALKGRWLRAAAAIRGRAGAPLDVVLLSHNPMLDFHRLEYGQKPMPEAARAEIEAAVVRVEALAKTDAERHAIVANAAYLLRSVGQGERATAMLLAEIRRSAAPSYYQTTLSQWALQDGKRDEARRLARDAVTSARGRPSRIQWAVNELSMYSVAGADAGDRAVLLERAAEVYALLFAGDDGFLGRNGARAARVAEILGPLRGEAAVKALVEKYSPRCDSLAEGSRAACRAHFAGLRGER